MAIFGGYYDTGGTQSIGRVIVSAGVVAQVPAWDEFDIEWLDVMRRYGVTSVHAKELKEWKGDLASWPLKDGRRDEQRRIGLLSELVAVAARHTEQAFVRVVALEDYRALEERYFVKERYSPYTLAQLSCLVHSQEWLQEKHAPATDHKWRAIIEAGDDGQGQFEAVCRASLKYMPAFECKKAPNGEDITPLALADLIAYEHHRLYAETTARRAQVPRTEWRAILRSLREKIPTDVQILERRFLDEMAVNLKLRRRR